MDTPEKLRRLLDRLDSGLVERQTHVRLAFLALLAGHHVLLLGPPGTAKSLLARTLCRCVAGAAYFEYLLTKFTHPDELFGPVSIPGLKEEDYRRLTHGYLPSAHVAFLDEVFKANSAILNSLLTLINERVFHHGKHRDSVPLLGLIAASNEPPESDGVLDALHDRFLVRVAVPPIASDEGFLRVCLGEVDIGDAPADELLTIDEIARIRLAARTVQASHEVRRAILAIRRKLGDEGIAASDRRWRWAAEILKVAAVTSGRASISLVDLLLLEHCFGNPGDSGRIVRTIVRDEMRAGVAIHNYREPLETRWNDLHNPPPADRAEFDHNGASAELPGSSQYQTYTTVQSARLAGLDLFDRECQEASQSLDDQLAEVTGEAESSLWTAEIPPELIAGFVAARRLLNRCARLSANYRIELEDSPLQRLLRLLRAEKRDRNDWAYYQRARAVLWIGAPDSRSDSWVPLGENGQSLFENQQECIDQARYWMRKSLGQHHSPGWDKMAYFVPLTDRDLFALDGRTSVARIAGQHVRRATARRTAAIAQLRERPGADVAVVPTSDRDQVLKALAALLERIPALDVCTVPVAPALEESRATVAQSAAHTVPANNPENQAERA
ncbi:MAG: AAA family ATPase [Proteobacteria bacterium]|nr:AAA family ATPase [Pseudomonadota bacterium]